MLTPLKRAASGSRLTAGRDLSRTIPPRTSARTSRSSGRTAGKASESEAYRDLAAVKTIAKPFTRHRIIVVDPGDRRQLRQVRCIRQHLRQRHPDRKPCEENLIHSAVQPAVDWGGWHVVFEQLRVFGLVGAVFLQSPPPDFRIYDKGRGFWWWVLAERIRRIRNSLRIEDVAAIAHIHLGFEMRRLEVIVADLEHLPEGELRMRSMPRQIRRRQAERVSLDLE